MTSQLPLGYGLVAVLDEGETDRPSLPPVPSTADHDWTTCSCATCKRWRRTAELPLLPAEGAPA